VVIAWLCITTATSQLWYTYHPQYSEANTADDIANIFCLNTDAGKLTQIAVPTMLQVETIQELCSTLSDIIVRDSSCV
jgi:hypothetical protein